MDEYSKYGIITLFNEPGFGKEQLLWLKHLNHIISTTQDTSSQFLEALEHDIFQKSVVIYDSENHARIVPEEFTVLDAAFFLLDERALNLKKVFSNGKEVFFFLPVRFGMHLQFELEEKTNADLRWLDWVSSSLAQNILKKFMQKSTCEERIKLGKKSLMSELEEKYYCSLNEISQKQMQEAITYFSCGTLDELFIKIADGSVNVSRVLNVLFRALEKRGKKHLLLEIKMEGHKSVAIVLDSLKGLELIECSFEMEEIEQFSLLKLHIKFYSDQQQLEKFIQFIERNEYVVDVQYRDVAMRRKSYMYMIVLLILWSADPVMSRFLLLEKNIEPITLVITDFCFVTLLLFVLLIIRKVTRPQYKMLINYKNPYLYFTAIMLFIHGFSSYQMLFYVSPVYYNSLLALVTLYFMTTGLDKRNRVRNLLLLIGISVLLLLIIEKNISPLNLQGSLLWIGVLMISSYFFYSFFLEQLKEEEHVKASYLPMLFMFYLVASICTLMMLPFTGIPQISVNDLPLTISYATVFGVLSLYAYSKYNTLARDDSEQSSVVVSAILIVTVLIQYALYNTISLLEIGLVTGLIAYVFLLMRKSYKKQI